MTKIFHWRPNLSSRWPNATKEKNKLVGLGYGNMLFQKISIPLPQKVFWFESPPPLWKFQLSPILCLKSLAFKTPHPLGISNDLLWGGYGYFLELHNGSLPLDVLSTHSPDLEKINLPVTDVQMFLSVYSCRMHRYCGL